MELAVIAAMRWGAKGGWRWGAGRAALATIGVTAPWFGVAGTMIGMAASFKGGCGDQSTHLGRLASNIADGIVPPAMGLAVGIPAFVAYRYFCGRLDELVVEMEAMSSVFRG